MRASTFWPASMRSFRPIPFLGDKPNLIKKQPFRRPRQNRVGDMNLRRPAFVTRKIKTKRTVSVAVGRSRLNHWRLYKNAGLLAATPINTNAIDRAVALRLKITAPQDAPRRMRKSKGRELSPDPQIVLRRRQRLLGSVHKESFCRAKKSA